jgi:hypothetical protein
MRLRFAVLASVLGTLAFVALAGVATAAPRHNRGVTINVTPNPILAGEAVLIYGQLNQAPITGQTIVLYHHLDGSGMGFTKVAQTTTDSQGFYSFPRAEDVVTTNRDWFVREAGLHGVHSRTVHERVAPLISLFANRSTVDTNHLILFYGHVTPNHAGERVRLQEQQGQTGNDWRTLASTRLSGGSNYAFAYDWRVEGVHVLRVVFEGDVRNVAGASDEVTVTVQQAQVKDFTINSSSPIISAGQSVTISGVLDQPGTSTPEPNTSVTLWGHAADEPYKALADAITKPDGSYSFTQSPLRNEVYQVRTTLAPARHTAQLFEGVRDVVTIAASSTSSTVGGQVTFTGTVAPPHAGHVIFLQRKGADGDWHDVAVTLVDMSSSYKFVWTFGSPGTKDFRVEIPGGPDNVGGASPPVTVTVSLPAVSTLPPGS